MEENMSTEYKGSQTRLKDFKNILDKNGLVIFATYLLKNKRKQAKRKQILLPLLPSENCPDVSRTNVNVTDDKLQLCLKSVLGIFFLLFLTNEQNSFALEYLRFENYLNVYSKWNYCKFYSDQ